MRRRIWVVLLGLLFVVVSITADVPEQISFQGKALESGSGTPLTGTHSVIFRIYNVSSGGSPIWTETQSVTFYDGLYNVYLGSVNPFPPSLDFNEQYYVSLSIDGGPEMTPRTPFTISPYAFRAKYCEEGGYWTQSGSSLYPDETSWNVGIGITSPSSALKLQVNGNIAPSWGSSTDASYRFGSGFENTGFSSPEIDQINLITAGQTRMSIDSDGFVSIGDYTLPITDGTPGQVLKTNGSGIVSWGEVDVSGDDWGSQVVETDGSLTGNGTVGNELGIATGGVTLDKISTTGSSEGKVIKYLSGTLQWADDETGSSGVVEHDVTLDGDGTSENPLKIAQQGAPDGFILRWNETEATWEPSVDWTNDADVSQIRADTNDWLQGAITLISGDNITLEQSGYTITINSSGGGTDSDWIISGSNIYSGVSGNVGIGTTSPDYKFEVNSYGGTNNTAIYADASTGASNFGVEAHASDGTYNHGIYARASGGDYSIGIDVSASDGTDFSFAVNAIASGSNDSRAISAIASGIGGTRSMGIDAGAYGSLINYGVYGVAYGDVGTKYGIYGTASGAGTNWAGYFDGDVHITGNLTVDGTYPGGGGSGITSISQGTGITCSPNPITSTGTVAFNSSWGDSRYINNGETASGDLSGTYPNPTVDGLQGRPVSSSEPNINQVLKWNGSTWAPADDIGGGSGDNLGNHTATMNLNMSDYDIENIDDIYVKDIKGNGVSEIDFYDDIDMGSHGIRLGGVLRTTWPDSDNDWGYLSGSGLSGRIYHTGEVLIARSSYSGYGDLEVGDSYSGVAIVTSGQVWIDANGVSSSPAVLYAHDHDSWYGIWGRSDGGIGVYGYGGSYSYDFYAGGPGTNYGGFTGGHDVKILQEQVKVIKEGMIVSSTGKNKFRIENSDTSISSTLPTVKLSDTPNDPAVFGVFAGRMNHNIVKLQWYFDESDSGCYGIVNALGEGRVWVTNINGEIQKGDLITTSPISGYGQKQDDDLIHSYTVGKAIETVDWGKVKTYIEFKGKKYKAYLIAVVYMCG